MIKISNGQSKIVSVLEKEVRDKLGILLMAPDPLKLKKVQLNIILTNIPGLTLDEITSIFNAPNKNPQGKREKLLTFAKKKLAIQYGIDCEIIAADSISSMNQTPQVLQVQGIPEVVMKKFILKKAPTTKEGIQQKMRAMIESKEGIRKLEQLLTDTSAIQESRFPEATASSEENSALGYYDDWKKKLSDELLKLQSTYNLKPEEASPSTKHGERIEASGLGARRRRASKGVAVSFGSKTLHAVESLWKMCANAFYLCEHVLDAGRLRQKEILARHLVNFGGRDGRNF